MASADALAINPAAPAARARVHPVAVLEVRAPVIVPGAQLPGELNPRTRAIVAGAQLPGELNPRARAIVSGAQPPGETRSGGFSSTI